MWTTHIEMALDSYFGLIKEYDSLGYHSLKEIYVFKTEEGDNRDSLSCVIDK